MKTIDRLRNLFPGPAPGNVREHLVHRTGLADGMLLGMAIAALAERKYSAAAAAIGTSMLVGGFPLGRRLAALWKGRRLPTTGAPGAQPNLRAL